jgi:hypothetical protein
VLRGDVVWCSLDMLCSVKGDESTSEVWRALMRRHAAQQHTCQRYLMLMMTGLCEGARRNYQMVVGYADGIGVDV